MLANWWTVEQVLNGLAPGSADPAQIHPLVDFAGSSAGAVTRRDLDQVPPAVRADTRVRDIVRSRRVRPLVVRPEATLSDVALQLRQHAGLAVVVDDNNHPVGIVTTSDLTAPIGAGNETENAASQLAGPHAMAVPGKRR